MPLRRCWSARSRSRRSFWPSPAAISTLNDGGPHHPRVALAARLAFIGVVPVSGIPAAERYSVGALRGDARTSAGDQGPDIALGLTHAGYEYFIVSDETNAQ